MYLFAYRVRADVRRVPSPSIATVCVKHSVLIVGTLAAAWIAATASAKADEIAPSVWSLNAAQELRYMSWSGNRGFPATGSAAGGSGAQFYAPLTVQATRQPVNDTKFELLGRGGYVRSHQSTPGLSGSVSTMTDTVVSGTATYLGIAGFQPFVSLSTNVPTGAAALYGSAARARMDPDIVDIATFGEGWNVGPTAGVNIPITPTLILTLSSGYTWRGAYNRRPARSGDAQSIVRPRRARTGNDAYCVARHPDR